MSAQRGSSAVEAAHRSIYPNIAGVPWWTALLIAVTTTAIGYGIDAGSGHKQLTSVFAGFYIAGCVVAVLAVRQEGLFTAIIQPPLILFCAVPGAYWLFHGGQLGGLKDLLINCGYPLIERFPLMLGTAGGILLIGLVRWYFGKSYRPGAAEGTADATAHPAGAKSFFLSGVGEKLNSLLGVAAPSHEGADDDGEASADAKRDRSTRTSQRRAPATGRGTGNGRAGTRSARAGSRHTRPSLDDDQDPAAEPRRRRRPAPPRDFDPADDPRRSRRRPRPQDDSDPRGQSPRQGRERGYREPYERSAPRSGRFDGYNRYESGGARRFAPYEGYDPYDAPSEPRRRRPTPNGTNGSGPTHHPISQVRYRGSGPDEERTERPSRPRAHGRSQSPSRADSREYDV
ncbi:DUF6542 domain-containing protein [Mycobacterium shigaense]|uniref:DUF6542 domain-containing protein n=1 Tax=Mycobacterium shigaense TaxID=722731 RepID=UPI000BBA84BF|nr:DUF6542 domain-containing protein [Mycobacterium shigaense]PRI12861.1 hypothetical protein B2J96_22465 [Mycobacterium shigaense]